MAGRSAPVPDPECPVKAREAIRAALVTWRPVEDAPSLARDTFGQLDHDEVLRLAMRAYTDEVRAELRRKDGNGVPQFTSVLTTDGEGNKQRIYKQTALFDVADYEMAITSYLAEARANYRVARCLAKDCARRLGVQLAVPGLDEGNAA